MQLRGEDDHTMVLVDDVHSINQMNATEAEMEVVRGYSPDPCMTVMESAMAKPGFAVLEELKVLPKRQRARHPANQHGWFCSGFQLTTPNRTKPETPTCLLYDLGLTRFKYELGFRRVVNVLPEFYEGEQRALIRLSNKVMPDMRVEATLFDLAGRRRFLRPEDVL
jgi:hypothetical protein